MKETIRQLFSDYAWPMEYNIIFDETKSSKRDFNMIRRMPEEKRKYGDTIIPINLWDKTVQPGWEISVYFSSDGIVRQSHLPIVQDSNYEMEGTDKPEEPVYEKKVKYTVDFFEKDDRYGNKFLYQKVYDAPVSLRESQKPKGAMSVLQEIKTVIRSQTSRPNDPRFDASPEQPSALPLYSAPADELNRGDTLGDTFLHIHSNMLLNALRAVIVFQSLQPLDQSIKRNRLNSRPSGSPSRLTNHLATDLENGIFLYPFKDLYFYREALKQYKTYADSREFCHTDESNKECATHIDVLLHYLETHPTIQIGIAEDMFSRGVTTFRWVWLLLQPGSDVYVCEKGDLLNAYVIESVEHFGPADKALSYTVNVWNLDFNGSFLSRTLKKIEVPFFEGERKISALPLFPIHFAKDQDRRIALIERGKRFVKVVRDSVVQEYTGSSGRDGVRKVSSNCRTSTG